MARRVLLVGTALVLLATSAFGAEHSTPASCTAVLPAGAVELGSAGRSGRTILLRFEGLGVVAPDLEAFQLLARCASRSNGDLTLRASAPVDAALFTQAVQRIAELVRLAVAEGQPNTRMSVEISTRADRQPIIEVHVSLIVPRAPEPVAPAPAQGAPAKDPRLAWDREKRYEERLAALKAREKQLLALLSARDEAAAAARSEREEREARARFDAWERTRALAGRALRSKQESRAAQARAALAEETRKALDQQLALREERLRKWKEARKVQEKRARAQEDAVAKVRAADRAERAAKVVEVAKNDGSWVQPVARRDLIGVEQYEPRGEEEGGVPEKMVRPQRAGPVKVAKVEPAPALAEPAAPVVEETAAEEAAEPAATEESMKSAAPVVEEPAEEVAEPAAREEPTKTTEVEPKEPPARAEATKAATVEAPKKTAEAEAAQVALSEPGEKRVSPLPDALPRGGAGDGAVEPAKPAATPETEPIAEETPVAAMEPEKHVSPHPDPLPRGGEGDSAVTPANTPEAAPGAEETPIAAVEPQRPVSPLPDTAQRLASLDLPKRTTNAEVDAALAPLKLAMKAYDEELRLKARRDAAAERALAARQAALEERQAALAQKASRLNAGKLPAVGTEEKELARQEKERLAEERKLKAAAAALAQKERTQAAEEARLAERARKLKERELAGRDEKSVEAARTARLELEAAAERSKREQEALALERLQADERAMSAREARLMALSKRVELATVKSETLLPGNAGRKQITSALGQTTRDIQRCVDAHLKRFPIAGRTQAVLTLTVDLRGRVSGSSISQGPLKGSFLESCLHDAAKSWRFPSSDSELELEVPLTLVGR